MMLLWATVGVVGYFVALTLLCMLWRIANKKWRQSGDRLRFGLAGPDRRTEPGYFVADNTNLDQKKHPKMATFVLWIADAVNVAKYWTRYVWAPAVLAVYFVWRWLGEAAEQVPPL